jgi:hypothetical protein
MKIADDPKIVNAAHVQHLLPSSWGTVYELTKLPEAEFTQAAASGAIHAGMTRQDATRLVKVNVVTKPLRITSVGYVTGELKPLVSLLPSKEIEAVPLGLCERLGRLEALVSDLSMSAQQHGGISAGSSVERRIRAAANKLLALVGQGTTLTH